MNKIFLNVMKSISSRIDQTEDRISELEDRNFNIIWSEAIKGKRRREKAKKDNMIYQHHQKYKHQNSWNCGRRREAEEGKIYSKK